MVGGKGGIKKLGGNNPAKKFKNNWRINMLKDKIQHREE